MKWFLVGYIVFASGGDAGIVQGYVTPSRQYQLAMPSQEVCQQIVTLNKFANLECWAKPDKE
jgi:hypothetical protein